MSKCRSCPAPVRWVESYSTGKPMPLDPEPNPEKGNITIEVVNGIPFGVTWGNKTAAEMRASGEPLYVSHFATCPNARRHRKTAATAS